VAEQDQDIVIATLLKRLWKRSGAAHDLQLFRHLSTMLEFWRDETTAQAQHWPDTGLVREGLRLWEALGQPLLTDVLLATDLHAGNVLQSRREPWLVIDPKPFIGDPAYDAVQHLHNCEERLHADPIRNGQADGRSVRGGCGAPSALDLFARCRRSEARLE
jgi:streptomycin 6-kinase